MNSTILGLLAETSIHPGAGQSTGFIDLPVAREKTTDYPVIFGSGVKGALRDLARQVHGAEDPQVKRTFGVQDSAGQLLVSDARLLLLPVRSMTGAFKWVTSPHLIERYLRDRERAGAPTDLKPPTVETQTWLGRGEGPLFLEERQYQHAGLLPEHLVELISPLIRHTITAGRLAERLVVLSDDDFNWFARYGLAINARNSLNDETKKSEALWYEETLPPDSLFFTLVAERDVGALDTLRGLFEKAPYLQLGGNETVGQGWFAVTF